MAAKQTKTYKTRNGAQNAAIPGTVPFELTSTEQAEVLGIDVKHVGKFVLISVDEATALAPEAPITPEDIATEGDPREHEEIEGHEQSEPLHEQPAEVVADPSQLIRGTRLEKSGIANPVKVVHDYVAARLAAEPEVKRSVLQKELEDMGVAYYTARTQIQVALKKLRGQRQSTGVAAPAEPMRTEVDEQTGEEVTVIEGGGLIDEAQFTPPAEVEG